MQALIYKAWQVGSLSDNLFKHFNIEMSKRGFRRNEPVQASHLREDPTTLKGIIRAHLVEIGMTIDEVSDMFGLPVGYVREIYQITHDRPKLKLVASH